MGKVSEISNISLATTYEVDNTFDNEKYIKMRLRVAHEGKNPNSSAFKVEDFEKAKDSVKNIPILANVIYDEDGNPQFGGHDITYEPNKVKDGEYKLIYKETPIGVVPETCNHEIKEFNGKQYVFVDGYIYKGYSNYGQDIIERDENIKLSMEILVDAFSFNAKEKVYNITDFRYSGITFLNNNYGTGMENALATTGSFEKNDYKEKFILMMEELKETLSTYDIKSTGKGGSEKLNDIINEKIETQAETFTETPVVEEAHEPEKFIKSFELSHSDIRYALYQLLSPIEVQDNEWYYIDQVYDDRFEYENWDGTKIYRQVYIKDGDNISLSGDRVQLYQERLTKEEKDALDLMRSTYSQIKSEFDTYKSEYLTKETEVDDLRSYKSTKLSEERKIAETEIFEKFEKLNGNPEYEALKENAKNYEISALEDKCFSILGKTTANFSARQKTNTVKIPIGTDESKEDPYGGLFDKYKK